MQLILASTSPRRKELLSLLGYDFCCLSPDIEEIPSMDEMPADYVKRLSLQKAQAGQQLAATSDKNACIIGADTIICKNNIILEKPQNYADAKRILTLLSDSAHEVLTAVTVLQKDRYLTELVVSKVWFRALSDEDIEQYWLTGEPQDKAGSYAIQGSGGRFVSRIEGSYHAIVGLPLYETEKLLHKFL